MTSTSETSNESTSIGAHTVARLGIVFLPRRPNHRSRSDAVVRPLDRFNGGSKAIVRQTILTGRNIRKGSVCRA
jgi:hypothetical protein